MVNPQPNSHIINQNCDDIVALTKTLSNYVDYTFYKNGKYNPYIMIEFIKNLEDAIKTLKKELIDE